VHREELRVALVKDKARVLNIARLLAPKNSVLAKTNR
jgi:hypothetical protein